MNDDHNVKSKTYGDGRADGILLGLAGVIWKLLWLRFWKMPLWQQNLEKFPHVTQVAVPAN
jgi:hypothetical protein